MHRLLRPPVTVIPIPADRLLAFGIAKVLVHFSVQRRFQNGFRDLGQQTTRTGQRHTFFPRLIDQFLGNPDIQTLRYRPLSGRRHRLLRHDDPFR
jgi:hypothetical protein